MFGILNRKSCENQERSRRCDRGRNPQNATVRPESDGKARA
ncbi:Uncharacterized protein dnm_016960 [Desulfonema magnum]|uniref:Uncharacterized protein n=1 Tax=Desulfonema magnum TaxID=45655 RepID=A0A975BHU1_9BACT|nr:Uncharacterized protein dnm_016960 [Desulfonema magnum]